MTLMLSIKTPIQKKSANMTFYKYILLYKKIWFGEIKNLSTPFYSLSFIYAYLNIKSALNCGRPEYN